MHVEVETCKKALELQLYSAGSVRSAKKSFKFEQPNAVFPMTLTEVGISMLFRPLQPEYLQLIVYQFVLIKTVEK